MRDNKRVLADSKRVILLICVSLLIFAAIGSAVAYIIVKTPDISNIFKPEDPTGDVLIAKTVSHPFADTYRIPDNIEFHFRVDLGADYAGKTVATSVGELTADENGTVTLTVKSGLSAGVYGLPTGLDVTVTEIDILPGFEPEGGAVKQATVPKRDDVTMEYRNVYTPASAPVNVTLKGIKELEGRDWQAGDAFTFSLEHKVGDAWEELGTRTVAYDPGDPDFNKFDFTDFLTAYEFKTAGTYSFRISEQSGTIGGIAYDETVSYMDILVGDADMDGVLEIQNVTASQNADVSREEDTYAVSVTIRNAYAPAGSAEVTLNILKVLEDLSGQNMLPAGFTFELKDKDGNVIATSQPTTAAGETSIKLVFGAIDAGKSFEYVLTEVKGTQNGMTYDETSHNIRVDVIDNLDGTIRAEIYDPAFGGQHAASHSVTFYNTYDPADTAVEIVGDKVLDGRDMREGEFKFLLYYTGDSFQIPEGTEPMSAVNSLDGSFTFGNLSFDKVGTYRYVLIEDDSAHLGGILYDEAVYQVTVTVTDENGTLKAAMVITDMFGTESDVVFTNFYVPITVSLDLAGSKTLNGASLKKDQFVFDLYEADKSFIPQGEALQSVKNDADGNIVFNRMIFETVGEFCFVIVENDSANTPGITYDDTVYGIAVTVTDDGDGKLQMEYKITRKTQTAANGETVVAWVSADRIEFVNAYETPSTEPDESTDPTEPTTEPSPTGDNTNLVVPIVLLSISGVAILGMLIWLIVRKRKED